MLLLTLELSSIILINRNGTELKFFLCSMGFCGMPETCLGLHSFTVVIYICIWNQPILHLWNEINLIMVNYPPLPEIGFLCVTLIVLELYIQG